MPQKKGYKVFEETRAKMRKPKSKEHIAKIKASWTPEKREKMRLTRLGKKTPHSELTKQKMRHPHHIKDPEEYSRMRREQMRKLAADPKWRERAAAQLWKINADPIYRKANRDRGKRLWADPVYREKWRAGLLKAVDAGNFKLVTGNDPEYREKWRAGLLKALVEPKEDDD
ncbi:MAG: hypothetical protein M0Q91_15080 [Methanoregula sp.]|jgi:hypothetical protein|nr:hypothetical protein [Methanoregula sp.]